MIQRIRATKMAETSGIEMMRLPELTPQKLADAADRLAAGPVREALPLTGDDGTHAVEVIEEIIARKKQ